MRFSEMGLTKPLAHQLDKRGISDEQTLREYLSEEHKHFHTKTRRLLETFLRAVEQARLSNRWSSPNEFLESDTASSATRCSKATLETSTEEGCLRTVTTGTHPDEDRESTLKRPKKAAPHVVFPEEVAAEPIQRLAQLEDAIEALLQNNPRTLEILRVRLGLQKTLPQTLEQVAKRLEVSRERIRQIYAKATTTVERLLRWGAAPGLRLHPDLFDFAKQLFECVGTSAKGRVLTVDAFKANLHEQIGLAPPLRKGVIRLMLAWNGIEVRAHKNDRAFVFTGMKACDRKSFCELLDELEKALQSCLEPLAVDDLTLLCPGNLQTFHLEPEDLFPLLDFEPDWLSEELFQVPLGVLKGRGNQAVRVLREWGEGLNFREIAERIRQAEGNDTLSDDNLRNQIITDERLSPVGRSGIWVLTEWKHVDTSTIKDVIAAVLSESSRPLSRDEISEAVQKRRPCAENSIDIYLTGTPEFLLVGRDLYEYRTGASAKDGWNRETLGQWIEEYFAASATSIIRMKVLASALQERAGLSEVQLSHTLGRHPALISQRDRSERVFVQYRKNWRHQQPVPRKRGGLSKKVDALLEELLDESPFLPLQDVVNLISEELGSPVSSLYTYVRNSTVCQTYEDRGQKWICRPDNRQVVEEGQGDV